MPRPRPAYPSEFRRQLLDLVPVGRSPDGGPAPVGVLTLSSVLSSVPRTNPRRRQSAVQLTLLVRPRRGHARAFPLVATRRILER